MMEGRINKADTGGRYNNTKIIYGQGQATWIREDSGMPPDNPLCGNSTKRTVNSLGKAKRKK
jgi:hypothetical protein